MISQPKNATSGAQSVVPLPWHDTLKKLIDMNSRMILLVGEPATGKTFFARYIAQRLRQHEPLVINGSPELDLASLFGRWTLVNGQTVYAPGPLHRSIKEKRPLIIEDLGLIPIEVLSNLLGLDQEFILDPVVNETLVIPKDYLLIATSNPSTLSACRRNNGIGAIFFDRFSILNVSEPTSRQWEQMLQLHFALDSQIVERSIDLFLSWREFSNTEKESSTKKYLTFRSLKRLTAMLVAGFEEHDAVELAIINSLMANDRDLAEGARLKNDMSRPAAN